MRQSIRQKLKQSRAFFFAIVAVAIVWVVTAMAEVKRFRESYIVEYDNVDTAKYAILHIDSVLTIDISSNGFSTFSRQKKGHDKTIHLDLANLIEQHKDDSLFSITLRTEEYLDIIKSQLDMRGVSEVSLVSEQLKVSYALRERKAFLPDISNVTFNFDKMVGLNGEPRLTPDSVYLYGSRESLSKVEAIAAKEQTINDIKESREYQIVLDDSWQKYSDLRISTNEVTLFIPVEKFVEKSMTLPITLTDKDDNTQWNLYPAEVTVNLLVPESKIESLDLSKCVVTASTKECTDNHLTPQLTKFPSCVRLKSITPEKIQYIIISE